MTESTKIKALEDFVKFQSRVIIIAGIVFFAFVTSITIDDLVMNKYQDREIEAISNCEGWHKIDDSYTEETILDSLKNQKAITEKDEKVYIVMNEENTFGMALFTGFMGAKTLVTYDYSKKDHKAKPRAAWH